MSARLTSQIKGPFGPPLSLNKRALFAENANICVFGLTILERLRFKIEPEDNIFQNSVFNVFAPHLLTF